MKKIKLFFIVVLCAISVFALCSCDSESATRIASASKTYVNIKADENVVEEENEKEAVIEENQEQQEENQEQEELSEIEAFVKGFLDGDGIKEKITEEELTVIVTEVFALDLDEEKVKLVVLAVVLNPSLTVDEVKDLSNAVLMALCDKPEVEEKIVYKSYKDYLNALEALYEEFAYVDELEEKVYALVDKLLEDLSDEEFDATCAELKQAKADYKAASAELEQAEEELNALYADVIAAHESEKSDKHHHGHHGYCDDYEDEYEDFFDDYFDDDDWEEYLEDYFNEWEKYFEEFDWDFEENVEEETEEDEQVVEPSKGQYGFSFSFGHKGSGAIYGSGSYGSKGDKSESDENEKSGEAVVSYKRF